MPAPGQRATSPERKLKSVPCVEGIGTSEPALDSENGDSCGPRNIAAGTIAKAARRARQVKPGAGFEARLVRF